MPSNPFQRPNNGICAAGQPEPTHPPILPPAGPPPPQERERPGHGARKVISLRQIPLRVRLRADRRGGHHVLQRQRVGAHQSGVSRKRCDFLGVAEPIQGH